MLARYTKVGKYVAICVDRGAHKIAVFHYPGEGNGIRDATTWFLSQSDTTVMVDGIYPLEVFDAIVKAESQRIADAMRRKIKQQAEQRLKETSQELTGVLEGSAAELIEMTHMTKSDIAAAIGGMGNRIVGLAGAKSAISDVISDIDSVTAD
jgi:hypothetical protein